MSDPITGCTLCGMGSLKRSSTPVEVSAKITSENEYKYQL
jgi:hypothetical protein